MDKRIAAINKYRTSLTAISKIMQWLFFAALLIYLVVVGAVITYAILPPDGFSHIELDQHMLFLPIVCNIIAGALSLFFLGYMFRKIALGLSPFCSSVARILTALGVVFLVGVVSGAIITPGTQIGSISESSAMTLDFGGPSQSVLSIDVKGLLFSVFCFAISIVFRYGTVLQSEADDLM